MPHEERKVIYSPARLRFGELADDLHRRQEAPREVSTIVRRVDFSDKAFRAATEGSALTPVPIAPIIKEHLTLLGEDWPEGYGFIGGYYDTKSRELKHLLLGRVIESDNGETMIFGVRHSPKISEHLFFQVQASENSSLLNLLPINHRKNMWLDISGDILSSYAQTFIIPKRI